eukprot:m.7256 g.7256  ORF g.7256 m.7256 type:complete len:779 (-) comp2177_c0_seq2:312-2648(-)
MGEPHVYLDHAGAALYDDAQLAAHFAELRAGVYGNPHSQNPSSQRSADAIAVMRHRVLRHFGVSESEYEVVFTRGATDALRILCDAIALVPTRDPTHIAAAHASLEVPAAPDDGQSSVFAYLRENHTSVVACREPLLDRGVRVHCTEEKEIRVLAEGSPCHVHGNTPCSDASSVPYVLAYPAQCNFSGRRYPLSWVSAARAGRLAVGALCSCPGRWLVLLDAAAFVSTAALDLRCTPADFVCLSFYKMFGFPTGLGALLVRAASASYLSRKTYFGGGTLEAYVSTHRFHRPHARLHTRLEDGTASFLAIAALKHGFDRLDSVGIVRLGSAAFDLARMAYDQLTGLRHYNGSPAVVVYADTAFESSETQGPTVAFNVFRADGSCVGYAEVAKMAAIHNIHVRTGCLCNAGACQRYLGIDFPTYLANMAAGYRCGDDKDVINGRPTGVVRISFGMSSSTQDVAALIAFMDKYFVERGPASSDLERLSAMAPSGREALGGTATPADTVLRRLALFPVKSCGAFYVDAWEIGPAGFVHDREWMIVDLEGICLTQKRLPRMCVIQPRIDRARDQLVLAAPGCVSLVLPLAAGGAKMANLCQAKVCSERTEGLDCGDEAADWLTAALGTACRLVQTPTAAVRTSTLLSEGQPAAISYSNESQFLLVSEASMAEVDEHCADPVPIDRFRGNLVLAGGDAFAEDSWVGVRIGGQVFRVAGPCQRCQMVCVDQATGETSKEPLAALALFRRYQGKTFFGVHLIHDPALSAAPHVLHASAPVEPLELE